MDDPLPHPPTPEKTAETAAEKAEAAAVRRRWLTLGEILAVIAVIISALTLWSNYRERENAAADRVQSDRKADARAATLLLKAQPGRHGITLAPFSAEQAIQSQTIVFPAALGIAPVDTVSDPRIESEWIEDGLKKARRAAGKADDASGDGRLPVLIRTRFYSNGAVHQDNALYDIGYTLEGRLLGGRSATLHGLSLIARTDAKGGQARLDALWKTRQPGP
ncbi:MAG: hypothetical protein ABS87_13995 [Sphingomonas sp. SCN 67-18]|uniref:hypothetical protein n=1 Tax=uncultured Sphingomonas sp. TaxID=158754 RepID=UPI00086978C4|nr:hypothetical protein [Sphingomonas sp. SCN 67-18]ODU19528.1 MAG: hypothetical protein ABS87_13995 [Sphingomonas sp. SCN 67-18]